jgi:predicted phosphodiesterase
MHVPLLSLLALLSTSVLANTPHLSNFKLLPYSLVKENGKIEVKFELEKGSELLLSRRPAPGKNGQRASIQKFYPAGELQSFEIPAPNCGDEELLDFISSNEKNPSYSLRLAATNCDSFETEKPFIFGFISDTQQYDERHKSIAHVIEAHQKKTPLQFIVNTGDIVQNGDDLKEWYQVLSTGNSYLKNAPLIAAIGNHDYRGEDAKNELPVYFKKFLRWEEQKGIGNLAIRFPELKLIVFNSNTHRLDSKNERAQWEWIEQQLRQAQSEKVPVILATHYPFYSSSINRFFQMQVVKLRSKLVPLIEKYGVKLVLSGHTHMYERSYKEGTHYLVAGPAGGRTNAPTWNNPYLRYLNYKTLTFTKISVLKGRAMIETFDQNDHILDTIDISLL